VRLAGPTRFSLPVGPPATRFRRRVNQPGSSVPPLSVLGERGQTAFLVLVSAGEAIQPGGRPAAVPHGGSQNSHKPIKLVSRVSERFAAVISLKWPIPGPGILVPFPRR
jgi:hypothetical protein